MKKYYEAVPVTGFTSEEVATARAVKHEMINGNMPDELKSIYMAGEICMWDELQLREVSAVPSPQEAVTVTDEDIHQFLRDERIIRVENHDACFDLIKKFVRSRIGKTE